MSRHRFTMKELGEWSDLFILKILVNERLNEVTNPYTPFAERMRKISNRLDKIKNNEFEELTKDKNIQC